MTDKKQYISHEIKTEVSCFPTCARTDDTRKVLPPYLQSDHFEGLPIRAGLVNHRR